jgi:hypothetical protein
MTAAVTAAVREASPGRLDVAVVALAKRIAGAIDDSAHLAEVAAVLVIPEGCELNDRRAWEALRRRVDDASTVAQLAPKLLAVLEQLGLTPAARAAVPKGGGVSGGGQPSAADALARFRERRASGARPG